MRAYRSSRKRPLATSCARSRLVPAISWKSLCTSLSLPTGRKRFSSIALSSMACSSAPSSPISSRNSKTLWALRSRPGRSEAAPVKAPLIWPNRVDAAPSPCSVAQLSSTNLPSSWWRAFFSSNTRRARKDLPAPVGPISSIGAFDLMATRSISSIMVLKRALRVAMPDLRKATPSACSREKRCAIWS